MKFRGKEYDSIEELVNDDERFTPVFFWVMVAGGVLALLMALIGYLQLPPQ